jgi:hypothetical protein
MNFSQRMSIEPPTPIQVGGMDQNLRLAIWNAFHYVFIEQCLEPEWGRYQDEAYLGLSQYKSFLQLIWSRVLGLPRDSVPDLTTRAADYLRSWVLQHGPWNKVYELIEVVAARGYFLEPDDARKYWNLILEKGGSGYRFVGKKLAPFTNPEEVKAIEEIGGWTGVLAPVGIQIRAAVEKLAAKPVPDFRGSMKESISAVETVCKLLANKPDGTLSPALDSIKKKIGLDTKLHEGFKNLYWYTCGPEGIRHGLMDQSTCDLDDAKYLLVSCSAFVNYLVAKGVKAELLKP